MRTASRRCVQLAFTLLASAFSQSLDSCLVATGAYVFIFLDIFYVLASGQKQTNKQKNKSPFGLITKSYSFVFHENKEHRQHGAFSWNSYGGPYGQNIRKLNKMPANLIKCTQTL